MKNKIIALSILSVLSLLSCSKKKQYTCGENFYYTSVFVVFKGFTSADLSKVVINTYEPNGQFSNMLSADTMDYSNAVFQNDTAYAQNPAGKVGFYELAKGKEYKITVLSANQSYKIGNLHDGAANDTYEQDKPCSGYGGGLPDVILPELLDVNGQTATSFYSPDHYPLVSLNH